MLTRINLENSPDLPDGNILESKLVKSVKQKAGLEGPTLISEQGQNGRFLKELNQPVKIEHNRIDSFPFKKMKTQKIR